MRGVARSFWAVVAVVLAVEAFIAVLAIRSVEGALTCWVSGLKDTLYLRPNFGFSVALVGFKSWIPALAVLLVCAATIVAGLAFDCSTFSSSSIPTIASCSPRLSTMCARSALRPNWNCASPVRTAHRGGSSPPPMRSSTRSELSSGISVSYETSPSGRRQSSGSLTTPFTTR